MGKPIVQTWSASALSRPPMVGDYYASQSGDTVLIVHKIRAINDSGGTKYRIEAGRAKRKDLPAGVEVQSCPTRRIRRKTPPGPRQVGPIETASTRRANQRKRIIGLKPDREHNVHPERIVNGTAVRSEWRDPDDLSPQRRTARTVSGYRAYDPIPTLVETGSLTRRQGAIISRLRRYYEKGTLQHHGSTNWDASGGGGSSGDVWLCEAVMLALDQFQKAKAAVGRNFEVLEAVCLQNEPLTSYARRRALTPGFVRGLLLGAIMALQDHFDRVDDELNRIRRLDGAGVRASR